MQGLSTLDSDTRDKRVKFIGKFHSLRQEFGFLQANTLFKIIEIYATSFYGSNLWNYSSYETERVFTSWNNMVRSVWNVSNTAHRYLVEELSGTKHIRTKLFQRYTNFINSLIMSKKKCLSALAEVAINDQGSTTRMNLNLISAESGFQNVLEMDPRSIASNIVYARIPDEEQWKVDFLKEIMALRNGDLLLENDILMREEIQKLIYCVSAM